MKRKLWIVVAVVLALSVALAACGNTQTPVAEPAPAAENPPPAAQEPAEPATAADEWEGVPNVTLILTNHDPDGSLPGQYCTAWAAQVEEKS